MYLDPQKWFLHKKFFQKAVLRSPPPLFASPDTSSYFNFRNFRAGSGIKFSFASVLVTLILIEKNYQDTTALPGIALPHHIWPRWPLVPQWATPILSSFSLVKHLMRKRK